MGFGERSIRRNSGWMEASRSYVGGHGKGESQFGWVGVVRGASESRCKVGVVIVISLDRAGSKGAAAG